MGRQKISEKQRQLDAQKMKLKALEAIEKKKLIFIGEVTDYLKESRSKFYKAGLNQDVDLLAAIEKNRVDIKTSMRGKWYKSTNATLQLALYKLVASDDEVHRLNGTKQEHTVHGELKTIIIE